MEREQLKEHYSRFVQAQVGWADCLNTSPNSLLYLNRFLKLLLLHPMEASKFFAHLYLSFHILITLMCIEALGNG